jgi:hypothetical protein
MEAGTEQDGRRLFLYRSAARLPTLEQHTAQSQGRAYQAARRKMAPMAPMDSMETGEALNPGCFSRLSTREEKL